MAERESTPNHLDDLIHWHQNMAERAMGVGKALGLTEAQSVQLALDAASIVSFAKLFRELQ